METFEPNNEEQFDSSSADHDGQPSYSVPQDQLQSTQGSPSLEGGQPAQGFSKPTTQVCPHCNQAHPMGTRYCPLTGKQLFSALPREGGQPPQSLSSSTSSAYLPQQPQYSSSIQQPYYPPPYPYYSSRPSKDRTIAIILEILPGLFGFLGFGWIYGGNAGTGIAWLVGFLFWDLMAIIIDVISGGLGLI